MNLSFKLPRRVVAISDKPVSRQKQKIADPEPVSPEQEQNEHADTAPQPAEESASEQVLDEAALQERIQEEAQKLAEALAEEKVEPLRTMVQQAVQELENQKQLMLERIEEAAVRLAKEVARKIIRKELETSSEIILQTVREVLQRLATAEQIIIRCHPEDAATLRNDQDFQSWLERHDTAVKIIDDDRIEPGGCFVESDRGEIDATIATQLEALEKQLFSEIDT